jgi:hypothetical protein
MKRFDRHATTPSTRRPFISESAFRRWSTGADVVIDRHVPIVDVHALQRRSQSSSQPPAAAFNASTATFSTKMLDASLRPPEGRALPDCTLVTVSPYANEPPRGTCRWKSGRRDRPPEGGAHRSAASDQTIGAGGWLIGPSVHARFTTLRDRDPMSCLSVRSGAGRPFEEISWGGR